MKGILYLFIVYIHVFHFVESSYFNGGLLMYRVLNTTDSMVQISLTQTYFYDYDDLHCNDTKNGNESSSTSSSLFHMKSGMKLNCTQYCNQSGDFEPLETDTLPIECSKSINIIIGQRTDIVEIQNESYFWISYQGESWPELSLPLPEINGSSIGWSLSSLINLKVRSNGKLNQPPVVAMISPIYITVGIEQYLDIPIFDGDKDDVRCRFAEPHDECGDVCYPRSLPRGTRLLSSCTLIITGVDVGDLYAVAIMVEDFLDSSSKDPLSSIPLQFLINVRNESICNSSVLESYYPQTTGQCFPVLVGDPFDIPFIAKTDCSESIIIQDIIIISFLNVTKLPIFPFPTSIWGVYLTWTPRIEQLGPQIICAIALDSHNIQSNQYCLNLFVVNEDISACSEETSTSALTTMDSTTDNLLTSETTNDDSSLVDTIISTTERSKLISTIGTKKTSKSVEETTMIMNNNHSSTQIDTDYSENTSISPFEPEIVVTTTIPKDILTASDVISSAPHFSSLWFWAGPLIGVVVIFLVIFCVWCCFYPPLRCWSKYFQKRPPPRKHSRRMRPRSMVVPLSNVPHQNPSLVANSYVLGNRFRLN